MSEKKFSIKSTATELELYDEDIQIAEFPHYEWVAKSVDYIVDLLNDLNDENERLQKENNDYEKQSRIINEKIDEYIKTADTYRIPISTLKYGDELGYFNGVYQFMKKLKEDIQKIED